MKSLPTVNAFRAFSRCRVIIPRPPVVSRELTSSIAALAMHLAELMQLEARRSNRVFEPRSASMLHTRPILQLLARVQS